MEREPDERFDVDETDLGEPTRIEDYPESDAQDDERLPDAAELQSRLSETRKPMGPPLDEPEEPQDDDAGGPQADAPPPPPTDPADAG